MGEVVALGSVEHRSRIVRPLRAVLLASTALALVSALPATGPAQAQDATWLANPGTADLNTGSNWDTGNVPTGTAFFDTSATTALTFSASTAVGGWTFNAGASNYTFTISYPGTLQFVGAGIVVNGGSATIIANNILTFNNASTAGSAAITNTSSMLFYGSSTAASATITNNYALTFRDTATAGNAIITNNTSGFFAFYDTSTAGSAAITNNGSMWFDGASTAGSASIGNNGTLTFYSNSTAGNATITNGAILNFYGTSTAGTATFTNTGYGLTQFYDASTAGSATITNNGSWAFHHTSSASSAAITNNYSMLFYGSSTAADATIINNYGLTFRDASTAGSATITSNSSGNFGFYDTSTAGSAAITNNGSMWFNGASTAGSATIGNSGTLNFNNTSTAASATITNNNLGFLNFNDSSTAGNAAITNNYSLNFNDASTAASAAITNNYAVGFYGTSTAASATITNSGNLGFGTTSTAASATITNSGNLGFNNASTAGNATITNNGGTVSFLDASTAGSASIANNGILNFNNASTAGSATITSSFLNFNNASTAGSATIANSGILIFNHTSNAGNAAITNIGGGLVDFSGSTGLSGDGRLSAGSIAGNGTFSLGANELTVGSNNLSTDVSGVISGTGGSLVKVGTGTLTLSDTNSYTGATTINGGTLAVNGSITSSSGVTVNSGGTLGGSGTVGNTTIASGGTLAPGNSIGTLTVNGNLAFSTGAAYMVEVSPTAADHINVTGIATLTGATVQAIALPGSFRAQTYTILNATGGFGGTQFAGITGSSFAPGARNPHLTYDTNNVYLVLDPGTIQLPAGASGNEASVAGGINKAVESGATPPAAFDALLNMTGAQLTNALNQVSGQPATGGATSGTQMTTSFLTLLLNPNGGAVGGSTFGGARSFASEPAVSPDAAAAYAAVTPKDKRLAAFAEPRWSVWGQVYGGYNKTDGDTADTIARTWGLATGFDYRAAPDLTFGFALAGGSTNWGMSQGLGGGKSDVLQLGAYGRKEFGPAYLSAALSYAWHNMSTDRTVTVSGSDKLTANFDAHSVGGRIEAGHRFATPWLGVTPYAALQVQTFRTPSYGESAVSGSNAFALSYDARSTTTTRTELGAWFDNTIALDRGNVLALHSRAAWAHDHSSDAAMGAVFQTLPGSNFTVNGAQTPANSLLTSLGAELRLASNWSVGARFDGEFASGSQTYAGTGTVRYAW
jgi:outer membrane autotransporter protein